MELWVDSADGVRVIRDFTFLSVRGTYRQDDVDRMDLAMVAHDGDKQRVILTVPDVHVKVEDGHANAAGAALNLLEHGFLTLCRDAMSEGQSAVFIDEAKFRNAFRSELLDYIVSVIEEFAAADGDDTADDAAG